MSNKPTLNHLQLEPGDIFIEYDNLKTRSMGHDHVYIKYGQVFTGNIRYSNFVHGGIISSRTHLIEAAGGDDLRKVPIREVLDHKEYRIFRPKNKDLAAEIAATVNYLMSNTMDSIPYPSFPTTSVLKQGPRATYHSLKNSKAFMSLLKGSRGVKSASELFKELEEHKLQKKGLFCTQLCAWVIQISTALLKEKNYTINIDIPDILNLRDTKATPARLVELLKKSPHFTEFKSIERNIKRRK